MTDPALPASDQDLIRACRKGDVQAWEKVLEKYERLVFSIPLRYGLDRDSAADIAQITFTVLIQSIDEIREDSHLGGWLATVAKRHTWRLLKRSNREISIEQDNLTNIEPLVGNQPNTRFKELELTQWLDQGLSKIDERCRNLLLALYFDPQEASYAEISEKLGLPVSSIGPTRARCLEKMKQILQNA